MKHRGKTPKGSHVHNRGSDPRKAKSPNELTPKGSHGVMRRIDELTIGLLCVPVGDEGIYLSSSFRGSRPAVMHV